MTTINAAAAMHVGMRSTIAALAIIVASGLAGCSTGGGGDLLQSGSNPLTTNSALTAPANVSRGRIAIAPVIGAPANVGKEITSQLGAETAKSNITVSQNAGEQVDYTLRGYIVAARESTATKVSYIWDVTNPTGARVHRITGEEVVSGTGAGDPWSAVSPQIIQVIAAKTSRELASWMPQKAPSAPAPVSAAPAGNQVAAANPAAGSTPLARFGVQPAEAGSLNSLAAGPATAASPTTTNSSRRPSALAALVPSVAGAPGDGQCRPGF